MFHKLIVALRRRFFIPPPSPWGDELRRIPTVPREQLTERADSLMSQFGRKVPDKPPRREFVVKLSGPDGMQLSKFFEKFDVLAYEEEDRVIDIDKLYQLSTDRGEAIEFGELNSEDREHLAILCNDTGGIGIVTQTKGKNTFEAFLPSLEHLVCFTYCLFEDAKAIVSEFDKIR
jgi:hypothetical protein